MGSFHFPLVKHILFLLLLDGHVVISPIGEEVKRGHHYKVHLSFMALEYPHLVLSLTLPANFCRKLDDYQNWATNTYFIDNCSAFFL